MNPDSGIKLDLDYRHDHHSTMRSIPQAWLAGTLMAIPGCGLLSATSRLDAYAGNTLANAVVRKTPSCRNWIASGIVYLGLSLAVHAGAVRNGNELALNYSEAGPEKRSALAKEREGMMHVFRFLRIQSIEGLDQEQRDVTLTTTEPSSDATVVLVVPASKKASRQLASELRAGDCVAAHGQILSMTDAKPPVFRVSPALLDHKDRAQPKAGREMLDEMKRGP